MALDVHLVPGAIVSCFIGPFGVGKTLAMLEKAAATMDAFDLDLVTNFPINYLAFREYCLRKNYKIAFTKKIHFVCSIGDEFDSSSFKRFFEFKNCIFLFDEAGLEFFSRDFSKKSKNQFKDLFQIRKYRSLLFYTCQSFNQLDKQLRDMTQLFIVCKGFQRFSKKHKSMRLYSRTLRAFDREAYELFVSDPAIQVKIFRPLLLSKFRSSSSSLVSGRITALIRIIFRVLGSSLEAAKYAFQKGNLGYFFVFLERKYLRFIKFGLCDEDVLFSAYDSFGIVKSYQQEDFEDEDQNFNCTEDQPIYLGQGRGYGFVRKISLKKDKKYVPSSDDLSDMSRCFLR